MRARVEFEIPTHFPIEYRLIILSIIKEAIRSQSEEFYQNFFIENKQKTKPYVFSTYFHNLEIKDNFIHADCLSITFSTSNMQLLIFLINGIQTKKEFVYNGLKFNLLKLELIKEKQISKSQVWFKTKSPFLIEDAKGKPLIVGDAHFEKELNFIVNARIKEIENRELFRPIKILECLSQKKVIKENFHSGNNKNLFYTVNEGKFFMESDPRDLTFIYQNGIGKRCNLGFGALELI